MRLVWFYLLTAISLSINGDNRRSAIFEIFHGRISNDTSVIHQRFHECSMNGMRCKFVAKNTKTSTYSAYMKKEDLPNNKENLIIWSKREYYSCLDWLYESGKVNGVYSVSGDDGTEFKIYCDFTSEPKSVWTLVTSFSLHNNHLFSDKPFADDFPYMEEAPNWQSYRLGKSKMEKLKSVSTHWRATCNFNEFGIDYKDYFRAKLSELDPLCCYFTKSAKRLEYVSIRGHNANDQLVDFWQGHGEHLHIDSFYNTHFVDAKADSIENEDSFGLYYTVNQNFRCTISNGSTTQHWMGEYYQL